jgi:FdhD protein
MAVSSTVVAFVVRPEAAALPRIAGAPRLTAAAGELLRAVDILNELGERQAIHLPQERPLTIFLNERELVTLMTLGAAPELLVLGYLFNQRLIARATMVESIEVSWDQGLGAARVTVVGNSNGAGTAAMTGCGQGATYRTLMEHIDSIVLPSPSAARITRAALLEIQDTMREHDDIHRAAGSVHSCALFHDGGLLIAIEDVGRHNALDTITGWMLLHGVAGGDKTLFTTGRLSAEMVIKAAYSGIPVLVSRNGVTAMGYDLAQRLTMTLFGRAAKGRFLCYAGADRFDAA